MRTCEDWSVFCSPVTQSCVRTTRNILQIHYRPSCFNISKREESIDAVAPNEEAWKVARAKSDASPSFGLGHNHWTACLPSHA